MLPARKNKVSEMKEVNELHPLLNQLFRKLPNITNVEYTHGNGEMGADFVLTKQHEVFNTTEYVGVIAKVGKILQDFSDIDRQIEECSLPRTISGGKNKIRINEVWVVVTETISNNAQQKIYEKFKIQNVQFIQGSKLVDLIDQFLPDFWSEMDLEVSEYLSTLKAKNEETDLKLSLIKLEDKSFYLEQEVTRQVPRHYGPKARRAMKPSKVKMRDEVLKNDVIFIEGGMGAGKSKLLRNLVDHYSQSDVYAETKILPVSLSFKDFVDRYGAVAERVIADKVGERIGLGARNEATYLLLIDALDEKNLPVDEQIQYLQNIKTEVSDSERIKVVITSRELRGIDPNHDLLKEVAMYEIAPLSMNHIIDFLKALCSSLNVETRILEDLKKSPLFREMPKSPIAAIILA